MKFSEILGAVLAANKTTDETLDKMCPTTSGRANAAFGMGIMMCEVIKELERLFKDAEK